MIIPGLKITERDVKILQYINSFGFCEMPNIEAEFTLKKPRNYQILKRLIQAKLVEHRHVFHGRHGIYRLTKLGASFTDLPALKKLPVGNYDHQLMVIQIYKAIKARYPDITWISERHLIKDKFSYGVGRSGHLADGIVVFPNGERVAIEAELTLKGSRRVEQIFKDYGAKLEFKEVWYFCPKKIMANLKLIAHRMPYILFYDIHEFINE